MVSVATISLAGLSSPATALASTATETHVNTKDATSMLRANIKDAAMNGDADAAESLEAFDALSGKERQKLEGILKNERVLFAAERPGSGVSMRQSNCHVTPTRFSSLSGTSTLAATYRVTATCDQEFLFAGISVTKVRLTGKYTTGRGRVLDTHRAYFRVLHSYEPGVSISNSDKRHYVSGGRGHFRTTVTVTRSIFGWEHSTRSGVLRLVTNGPGVVSCGWV